MGQKKYLSLKQSGQKIIMGLILKNQGGEKVYYFLQPKEQISFATEALHTLFNSSNYEHEDIYNYEEFRLKKFQELQKKYEKQEETNYEKNTTINNVTCSQFIYSETSTEDIKVTYRIEENIEAKSKTFIFTLNGLDIIRLYYVNNTFKKVEISEDLKTKDRIVTENYFMTFDEPPPKIKKTSYRR